MQDFLALCTRIGTYEVVFIDNQSKNFKSEGFILSKSFMKIHQIVIGVNQFTL